MTTADPVPLCVDLDGTITPVDTLHELLLGLVKGGPFALFAVPAWLGKGKTVFKQELAARASIDATTLPYNQPVLEWLRKEHISGRKLVLATGSNRATANAIASHLGLFDEVIATDAGDNLSGEGKRRALVERFGEGGFDYAGNSKVDEPVWKSARKAIVVGPSSLAKLTAGRVEPGRVFVPRKVSPMTWIKAARLYQWVKNILIFVPAMLAHDITTPAVFIPAVLAFVAFGLCASSVYIVNDLLDLSADRTHWRKRLRPFAAGDLSVKSGFLATGLLLIVAMIVSTFVTPRFCEVLALYYVFTWAYSLSLKRQALLDVVALAGLYTIRIVAGAAATGTPLSLWLVVFSSFLFLSLGIVKRYTELDDLRSGEETVGRGYSTNDLPWLRQLGITAGYIAVVVMALYFYSPDSDLLYRHSKVLWLICPLLMLWLRRVWLLTLRGEMHDDPVIFAFRDRVSLAIMGLIAVIFSVSI